MQQPQTSIEYRVHQIEWANYQTANGDAQGIPLQICALASDNDEIALKAAHQLWSGLCHQHAYLSSAALPSYPFLLEILDKANSKLSVEILDIFRGFSSCSIPNFPKQSKDELEWRNEIRRQLIRDAEIFERLIDNDDECISGFACDIISDIQSNAV
jgi:hypothetical protein